MSWIWCKHNNLGFADSLGFTILLPCAKINVWWDLWCHYASVKTLETCVSCYKARTQRNWQREKKSQVWIGHESRCFKPHKVPAGIFENSFSVCFDEPTHKKLAHRCPRIPRDVLCCSKTLRCICGVRYAHIVSALQYRCKSRLCQRWFQNNSSHGTNVTVFGSTTMSFREGSTGSWRRSIWSARAFHESSKLVEACEDRSQAGCGKVTAPLSRLIRRFFTALKNLVQVER